MNLPLPLCVGEAILSKVFSLIATWKTRTILRAEVYSFCRALQRRWQACRHVCFHEVIQRCSQCWSSPSSAGAVGGSVLPSLCDPIWQVAIPQESEQGEKKHTLPLENCADIFPQHGNTSFTQKFNFHNGKQKFNFRSTKTSLFMTQNTHFRRTQRGRRGHNTTLTNTSWKTYHTHNNDTCIFYEVP